MDILGLTNAWLYSNLTAPAAEPADVHPGLRGFENSAVDVRGFEQYRADVRGIENLDVDLKGDL